MHSEIILDSFTPVKVNGITVSEDTRRFNAPWGSPVAARGLPVEFHCHGIGDYDFSNFPHSQEAQLEWLKGIDAIASDENIVVVVTLFLKSGEITALEGLVQTWWSERAVGRLSNIAGFGIEGPMLASVGGTPKSGGWSPSGSEWRSIAELGKFGVIYVVISQGAGVEPEHFRDVVDQLCRGGICPALGHFPQGGIDAIVHSIDVTVETAKIYGVPVLTDHLFNDMPRNFRHAWRTHNEKKTRLSDLLAARSDHWSVKTIEEEVGPVAATIMRYALQGDLNICLNFDGEHVDISILRKTLDFLGADPIIAMTDRVDRPFLKGNRLSEQHGSALWYVRDNIVAAGRSTIDMQMTLMASQLRMTDTEILKATVINPQRMLPPIAREQIPKRWVTSVAVHSTRSSRRSKDDRS